MDDKIMCYEKDIKQLSYYIRYLAEPSEKPIFRKLLKKEKKILQQLRNNNSLTDYKQIY